jgi:hypothetical protein
MAETQNPVLEQFAEMVIALPVWEESVWTPLQKKNWEEAGEKFYSLISKYRPQGFGQIFWEAIVSGVEHVRGEVSEEEWKSNFLPFVAATLARLSDETTLSRIYQSLDFFDARRLHSFILFEFDGETLEEKILSIRDINPRLLNYLSGTPLNALAGLILPPPQNIPQRKVEDLAQHFNDLPDTLGYAIASPSVANTIFSVFEKKTNNLLSAEYALADMLLGFTTKEDAEITIGALFDEAEKKSGALNTLFSAFSGFLGEIQEFREYWSGGVSGVTVPVKSQEEKEGSIKINKVEFPVTQEKSESDGPLILRKESRDESAPTGKTFGKSFSLPFGFFKSKTEPDSRTPVQVKIDTGGTPAGPTGTPRVQKPSISIFEKIRGDLKPHGSTPEPKETPKTVHYSTFKTEIPEIKPTPEVEGNTVSFKK